jgi:hypothetical protein
VSGKSGQSAKKYFFGPITLEQIVGWLKTRYPNNESMRVSHETIYRSLFIQARGACWRFALPVTGAETAAPKRCRLEHRTVSVAGAAVVWSLDITIEPCVIPDGFLDHRLQAAIYVRIVCSWRVRPFPNRTIYRMPSLLESSSGIPPELGPVWYRELLMFTLASSRPRGGVQIVSAAESSHYV